MSKKPIPAGTPTPRSGIYEQLGPRGGKTGEQADFDSRKPLPPTDPGNKGWALMKPAHHKSGK